MGENIQSAWFVAAEDPLSIKHGWQNASRLSWGCCVPFSPAIKHQASTCAPNRPATTRCGRMGRKSSDLMVLEAWMAASCVSERSMFIVYRCWRSTACWHVVPLTSHARMWAFPDVFCQASVVQRVDFHPPSLSAVSDGLQKLPLFPLQCVSLLQTVSFDSEKTPFPANIQLSSIRLILMSVLVLCSGFRIWPLLAGS